MVILNSIDGTVEIYGKLLLLKNKFVRYKSIKNSLIASNKGVFYIPKIPIFHILVFDLKNLKKTH